MKDQNSQTTRQIACQKYIISNTNTQSKEFDEEQRQSAEFIRTESLSSRSSQLHPQNDHQPINNNERNINENAPGRAILYQFIRSRQIIQKLAMVMIAIFIFWLDVTILFDDIQQKRQPMFLSTFDFSTTLEVISPQQADYIAFINYMKIVSLGKQMRKQGKIIKSEQLNQFNNITFKEFNKIYKVVRMIQLAKQYKITKQQQQNFNSNIIDPTNIDTVVNLTEYLSSVVDQFKCSSCYSFPVTATVEYLYRYKYNITVKLSEQELIDCAHTNPEDNGCIHGNMTKGFEYVRDVGLVSSGQYPYRSITGRSFKCNIETIKTNRKYKISGFKVLPAGSCAAIKGQLISGNIVAAMINIGELSSYIDGTFTDCRRNDLNHAVTIVGLTEKQEWIVRNSWGRSWGNYGYFILGHGNTCGICSYAIVPILEMKNGEVIGYGSDQEKNNK